MAYLIAMGSGVIIGLLWSNLLWKWKIIEKARTGQRLELDGDLYAIRHGD